MSEKKERVVIVDDHPLFRERLSELINHELNMEVFGEAEDAQQAIDLIRNTSPDLAIVDITLKRVHIRWRNGLSDSEIRPDH